MPSVLFISKGESKPSTRYRAKAFFPALRAEGWEPRHVDAGRSMSDRRAVLAAARAADVVVILRKTFGGIFRRQLRRAARRMIFDLDDAIFVRDDGGVSRLRERRFSSMVSMCDQVWAGNAHLAETSRPLNASVVLMPTAVDITRYAGAPAPAPDRTTDLVWIGSSSTRKYLEDIVPALAEAAPRVPRLRLKIIADFTLDASGFDVIPIAWDETAETQHLAASHIGVAPMTEDRWTRGKCGLKVLQYMAARLPVVATNAGVHREIVIDGETGVLVDDAAGWGEAIGLLAGDPARREAFGAAGRARVEREYAVDVVAKRMLEALAAHV